MLQEMAESIKSDLQEICEEECSSLENMPENLQGSEKYEKIQNAYDNLESASDTLETIIDEMNEINEYLEMAAE